MSELSAIERSDAPVTRRSLTRDLEALGVQPGMTLLVHCSLSLLGWVVGGPVTLLLALEELLGDGGTLVMPTFSGSNSDPAHWNSPPIPRDWWPIVRAETPAYDPALTPTRMMGRLADTFRSQPRSLRSPHPQSSFAARGPHATLIVSEHPLAPVFGESSPLGRLYELGASILLLGVSHANNTSLHLAETRASYPGKTREQQGAAMLVDGVRQWEAFEDLAYDDEDFAVIGAAFEQQGPVSVGRVGHGEGRLMPMRPLVDFGVEWMNTKR